MRKKITTVVLVLSMVLVSIFGSTTVFASESSGDEAMDLLSELAGLMNEAGIEFETDDSVTMEEVMDAETIHEAENQIQKELGDMGTCKIEVKGNDYIYHFRYNVDMGDEDYDVVADAMKDSFKEIKNDLESELEFFKFGLQVLGFSNFKDANMIVIYEDRNGRQIYTGIIPLEETEHDSSDINDNWEDVIEFKIDGVKYQMPCLVQDLVDNGWTCDEMTEYVMNPDTTLVGSGSFVKQDYLVSEGRFDNFELEVGAVINDGDELLSYNDCEAQVIRMGCKKSPGKFYDKYPDVELAYGLTFGSTTEEIFEALGEDYSDMYRSDDLGYTVYTYEADTNAIHEMELTVYDEDGLCEIRLACYK